MSFRYDGKSVFMFIMSAMMINMFVSGTYVYLMASRVANLKEFILGIGLIIITTMLCKVVMSMRNLHTSDQIKELKKLIFLFLIKRLNSSKENHFIRL